MTGEDSFTKPSVQSRQGTGHQKGVRSSVKSPAEGEGNEGFPPPPDKDLESPSSTRLEALVPSRDSRARTPKAYEPLCASSKGECLFPRPVEFLNSSPAGLQG